MKTPHSDGRQALAELMQQYSGASVQPHELQMVAEGASGRCIVRGPQGVCDGIIGIYWTPARADNASFLPAAHGLRVAGVRVPAVLAERALPDGCGACLVEDLGRESLLSLKGQSWPDRRAAYTAALHELHSFHSATVTWPVQPPFDAALYRWEQEYFTEHYLQLHRKLPTEHARGLSATAAWQSVSAELARLPRYPIHRDCQSQNIMLRGGHAWFIDFQGMRYGLPEYDLAALLYDPYMELVPTEREELLDLWQGISSAPLRQDIYAACALQRLMQALGAFANIGYNAGNPWYLSLIPAGERALLQAAAATPQHSFAAPLATCLTQLATHSA